MNIEQDQKVAQYLARTFVDNLTKAQQIRGKLKAGAGNTSSAYLRNWSKHLWAARKAGYALELLVLPYRFSHISTLVANVDLMAHTAKAYANGELNINDLKGTLRKFDGWLKYSTKPLRTIVLLAKGQIRLRPGP